MDVYPGVLPVNKPTKPPPTTSHPPNISIPVPAPVMALNYVNDTIETVETSKGVFYWPTSSSPEKTNLILDTYNLPHSTLDPNWWAHYLQHYPDQLFVTQILRGLKEGFTIGYTGPRTTFCPPIPQQDPKRQQLLKTDFDHEISVGRMIGPYDSLPDDIFPYYRVSPSFLVPKSDNKWRRIDNLSAPAGLAINDSICKEDTPVDYITVDEMMNLIAECTTGTLMTTRDVVDAYRNILINPSDWPLMCLGIRDKLYCNIRMCMGGTSSCGIFGWLSDLTVWIITNTNWPSPPTLTVRSILDDFWILHLQQILINTNQDAEIIKGAQLEALAIDKIFANLGWPLKETKAQTATTSVLYIGIIWDSVMKSCTVPASKAHKYEDCIQAVLAVTRRTTNLKILRSLVGSLVYVAKFLPQARCRLFYLFKILRAGEQRLKRREVIAGRNVSPHKIPLRFSQLAIDDLEWWAKTLEIIPSVFPIIRPIEYSEDYICTTDAAPSEGIGGFWRNQAFYFKFNDRGNQLHSTEAELLALLMATVLWGDDWSGHRILWRTDCICHVRGLFKLRSTAPNLLPIHNELDWFQVQQNFAFAAEHIAGEDNILADKLSRGCVEILPTGWHLCPLPTQLPHILSTTLCRTD